MSKNKWDTELYKAEVSKIHNSFYSYDELRYVNQRTRVQITCPKHGEFWQFPQVHLKGGGCMQCSKDNEVRQRLENFKIFEERAKTKHVGFYEYLEDSFKNYKTKTKIRCPQHGIFEQYPDNHLKSSGCPKCDAYNSKEVIRGITAHIPKPRGSEVVPLTQGKYTFVDEEDYERIMKHNWHISDQGYAVCKIKEKTTRMHRFLLNLHDSGVHVDHENGNRLDNRKSNIRTASNKNNSRNRKPIGGSSKYKGVAWYKAYSKWCAYITHNYKRVCIGYFDDEDEAARAYNQKAVEIFKDFSKPNIIEDDVINCTPHSYKGVTTFTT